MRHLAFILTFILYQSFAAAAGSVPPPELPFHLTSRGGVIVRVGLDDGRRVPFLVDTGSNGSAISESLATALRLPIVAKTTVTSAIGQKPSLVARIEHLLIGSVSAEAVLATVIPDDDLALPDDGARRVQGIVGQDVLAALRYTIDYRARRIVWREAAVAAPDRAALLRLEPRDDRFLAVMPQGPSTLRLVPDTGSDGLVLFRRGATLTTQDGVRQALLSGVAGSGEVQFGRLGALRIGGMTLTDVPVAIVERPPAAETADGLLPLHLFARVTFNGPERELVIEPR